MSCRRQRGKVRCEASVALEEAMKITGLSPQYFFAAVVVFTKATRINIKEVVAEFLKVKSGEVVYTSHRLSNPVIAFADWVRTKEVGYVQRWLDLHRFEIKKLVA